MLASMGWASYLFVTGAEMIHHGLGKIALAGVIMMWLVIVNSARSKTL